MRFVFMVYSIAGWVALALLVAYWVIVERVLLKRGPVAPSQAPPPPPSPRGFEVVPSPPPPVEGSEAQKTTKQPESS
jgi:hypothetical protein